MKTKKEMKRGKKHLAGHLEVAAATAAAAVFDYDL